MELVLPDLSLDVAVAVLEFIYTDNLSFPLTPLSPMLPRLLAAAETYHLTRLVAMCKLLLGSPFADILRKEQRRRRLRGGADGNQGDGDGDGDGDDDDDVLLAGALAKHAADGDVGQQLVQQVVSKGLDGDFEAALVEGRWADLWFTSEAPMDNVTVSRRTPAHQVMLCARSQYFRALLMGGMQGGDGARTDDSAPPEPVEIDAPDAPITLARLLHYLYTGVVSPATTDQFLQDLVAADRFGIDHLKALCESCIALSVDNAPRVLELADLVSAPRLREAALTFMVRRLPAVSASPAWEVLARRNPALVDELLERVQRRNDAYYGVLASAGAAAALGNADGDDGDTKADELTQEPFPWKQVVMLLLLAVLYRAVAHHNTAMTNFVPAINVVVLLGTLVYAMYSINK